MKELKLGAWYTIEYDDHFQASRVSSEDAQMLNPVTIVSTGRLVAITPKQYNLEHGYQKVATGEYTHSIHGIMRSCITKVIPLVPKD